MDIPTPSLTSFATRILVFKFSSFWHVVVVCACGVVSAVGPGDLCSAISSTKIAKHLNPNFDECPVLCSNFLRCALQTAGIIINGSPKNKHRNSAHTYKFVQKVSRGVLNQSPNFGKQKFFGEACCHDENMADGRWRRERQQHQSMLVTSVGKCGRTWAGKCILWNYRAFSCIVA